MVYLTIVRRFCLTLIMFGVISGDVVAAIHGHNAHHHDADAANRCPPEAADVAAMTKALLSPDTIIDDGRIGHPDDDPALGDGTPGDYFGSVVAIDGDLAVIGAHRANPFGLDNAGAAYVFARSGGKWLLEARLVSNTPTTGGLFGWSVAVDGDTILVGTPVGETHGLVHVFTRSNQQWSEQAVLRPANPSDGDYFGWTVVLTGEEALVGAIEVANTSGNRNGSVHVFTRSGATWFSEGRLLATDGGPEDAFGMSIAKSGATVIIGAPQHDTSGVSDSGAAYVFSRGTGGYAFDTKLTAQDLGAPVLGIQDQFGISVAVHDTDILVGAFADDTLIGTDTGAVHAFARNGGLWSHTQKLIHGDAEAHDFFGQSVALGPALAVVGAFSDSTPAGTDSGTARVFVKIGNQWQPLVVLQSGNVSSGDNWGWGIALSGHDLLISAPVDDTDAGTDAGSATVLSNVSGTWVHDADLNAGAGASGSGFGEDIAISGNTALVSAFRDGYGEVFVFQRCSCAWLLEARLRASDAVPYDSFGASVALDGDTALIGAPMANLGTTISAGAAYVFVRNGITWTEQAKLVANDGADWDFFGYSVAIDGDSAVVGAPFDDVTANDEGAAHVFERQGATWSHHRRLTAPVQQERTEFGASLALAGSTMIIGAPGHNGPNGQSAGAAFKSLDINGNWSAAVPLQVTSPSAEARFGAAVDIRGNVVTIGAPFQRNAQGVPIGMVTVLEQDGVLMSEVARLAATSPELLDEFGSDVAIGSGRILIGANPMTQGGAPGREAGLAYLFVYESNVWQQEAEFTPQGGLPGDRFGAGVALSDNTALIGAPGEDSRRTDAVNVGAVHVWSNRHRVTVTSSDGGTVSPTMSMVLDGQALAIDVVPDHGFEVTDIQGCGGGWASSPYLTAPVFADCTVHVTFNELPFFNDSFEGN